MFVFVVAIAVVVATAKVVVATAVVKVATAAVVVAIVFVVVATAASVVDANTAGLVFSEAICSFVSRASTTLSLTVVLAYTADSIVFLDDVGALELRDVATTTDCVVATGNGDAHVGTFWSVVTAFVHLLSIIPDADLP